MARSIARKTSTTLAFDTAQDFDQAQVVRVISVAIEGPRPARLYGHRVFAERVAERDAGDRAIRVAGRVKLGGAMLGEDVPITP